MHLAACHSTERGVDSRMEVWPVKKGRCPSHPEQAMQAASERVSERRRTGRGWGGGQTRGRGLGRCAELGVWMRVWGHSVRYWDIL